MQKMFASRRYSNPTEQQTTNTLVLGVQGNQQQQQEEELQAPAYSRPGTSKNRDLSNGTNNSNASANPLSRSMNTKKAILP